MTRPEDSERDAVASAMKAVLLGHFVDFQRFNEFTDTMLTHLRASGFRRVAPGEVVVTDDMAYAALCGWNNVEVGHPQMERRKLTDYGDGTVEAWKRAIKAAFAAAAKDTP